MTGGLVKMLKVATGADLLPAAGRVSLRDTWVCGGGEEIGLSRNVRSVCVQLAVWGTGRAGVGG